MKQRTVKKEQLEFANFVADESQNITDDLNKVIKAYSQKGCLDTSILMGLSSTIAMVVYSIRKGGAGDARKMINALVDAEIEIYDSLDKQ